MPSVFVIFRSMKFDILREWEKNKYRMNKKETREISVSEARVTTKVLINNTAMA